MLVCWRFSLSEIFLLFRLNESAGAVPLLCVPMFVVSFSSVLGLVFNKLQFQYDFLFLLFLHFGKVACVCGVVDLQLTQNGIEIKLLGQNFQHFLPPVLCRQLMSLYFNQHFISFSISIKFGLNLKQMIYLMFNVEEIF